MRKYALSGLLLSIVCVCSSLAFGFSVDFAVSDYNPAVGSSISLQALPEREDGVVYKWDLDGDGDVDVANKDRIGSDELNVAGYVKIVLGKENSVGVSAIRTKLILVGRTTISAARSVIKKSDGTAFVRLRVSIRSPISAPGLLEEIPAGWRLEVVDPGGGMTRVTGRELQVLWLEPVEADTVYSVTYRLTPTSTAGKLEFSGESSGYANGRRETSLTCGDIELSS